MLESTSLTHQMLERDALEAALLGECCSAFAELVGASVLLKSKKQFCDQGGPRIRIIDDDWG